MTTREYVIAPATVGDSLHRAVGRIPHAVARKVMTRHDADLLVVWELEGDSYAPRFMYTRYVPGHPLYWVPGPRPKVVISAYKIEPIALPYQPLG